MRPLLIILAVVVGAGCDVWGGRSSGPEHQIVERGGARVLVVNRSDGKAELTVGPALDQIFMLFGAQTDNIAEYEDAWVAGIPIETASHLAKRYPDFHMCKSRGAGEAQSQTQDIGLVSDKAPVRDQLTAIVKEFHRQLGLKSDGRRVCVRLVGSGLQLARFEKGGAPITVVNQGNRPLEVFVEQVESLDCEPLLSKY